MLHCERAALFGLFELYVCACLFMCVCVCKCVCVCVCVYVLCRGFVASCGHVRTVVE